MSGTYERREDDYTHNALNTFSFGNATTSRDPSTSSTSSHTSEQDIPPHIDVTPRPSVIGPAHHRYHSTRKTRDGEDDEENHDRNSDSPNPTRSARYSPDLSPSHSRSTSAMSNEDRQQVEFSSDDDFGFDYDDDDDMDRSAHEMSRIGGRSEADGLTSITEGHLPSAADLRAWRRGSLPGPAILNVGNGSPSSTPTASENGSYQGRDREASVATLRRPSKSLDNGLRTPTVLDSTSQRTPQSAVDPSPPPIIFSSSFSFDNTARNKSPPSVPPTQSVDPRTPLPPPQSAPAASSSQSPPADDFGFDLAYITQGITSFSDAPISASTTSTAVNSHSQFTEFIARRPSLTPSTASGSRTPRWWNTWALPRRHSAVSTGSGEGGAGERINGGSMFVYDDSFAKGLVRWGGEGYKDQRKEWCFRRIPDVDNKNEGEAGGKAEEDDESQSSTASIAGSGEEKEKERDKEKERKRAKAKERAKERERRAPENWRGMAVGTQEVWHNDLVGHFNVVREELVRTSSAEPTGKGPQQRLSVRSTRKHTKVEPRRRDLQHPPVIVHKHSKALAFSLTRYYKAPPASGHSERVSSSTYTTASSTATKRPHTPATIGARSVAGSIMPSTPTQRGTARVILLAPRKVQEAFTSTTTTKMLAEHGLLQGGDDDRRGNQGRRKSAVASAPAPSENSNRRRSKSVSATAVGSSSKGKKKEQSTPKDPIVSTPPLLPPSTTAPTDSLSPEIRPPSPGTPSDASPPPLVGELKAGPSSSSISSLSYKRPTDDESYDSQDDRDLNPTSSSSYSSSTGDTSMSGHEDDTDDHDIDTDDESPKLAFRTPHRETYSAMYFNEPGRSRLPPPSQNENRSGLGLFDRLRSRGNRSTQGGLFGIDPVQPFDPPWMTFEPRGKQEQQKKVVDNLNMSFKDVGLLPSTPRDRSFTKSQGKPAKRKNGASTLPPNAGLGKGGVRKKRDVFENIPPDALYMLLPLWPGDTDHISQRNFPFARPHVPLERRKFLLVCYKAIDPKDDPENKMSNASVKGGKSSSTNGKGDKVGTSSVASSRSRHKLASRISSTSSNESKPWDDKNILLPAFLVIARQVSYADLQGSGVRMPEEGLAVNGPLEEAFRQMPFSISDEFHTMLGRRRASWASTSEEFHGAALDFVLGACYSREAGVEFDPEGLVALGLCTVLNPLPKGTVAEEWGEQGNKMHQVKLTPIGMAVMEMAWIGGMALTSFGPY
ncbi:hypothetical protein AAF712_005580 [Marasmius tenuissimus]|uniref:Uncharacterized protein n=1 Tax=Marasmius tenuissimus TaxID=585030 RepID=A0ABR3A073_9AGAR